MAQQMEEGLAIDKAAMRAPSPRATAAGTSAVWAM
jgi:hypothetical protein